MYSVDRADNAYNVTLASDEVVTDIRTIAAPECERKIVACEQDESQCAEAADYCSTNVELPFFAAKRNPYDIREACDEDDVMKCFHFEHIDAYLNSDKVLAYLGVDTQRSKPWRECDAQVGAGFLNDEMKSYADDVRVLLEAGVRVLVYAGDADLMCNWIGNDAWTKQLEWSGHDGFNAAPNRVFVTAATVDAGRVRSFENFACVRVFNSGHMVPMDQPAVSLELIDKFFKNEGL